MGSYEGNTSIVEDRFLEIDSWSETVRILEIDSGTKHYLYLVSLQKGKNVFSTASLICFPKVKSWLVPELGLGSSGRIRILSPENHSVLDELTWDSHAGPGFNSSSQKVRRSASLVSTLSGKKLWKNSALSNESERKSSCFGTEASPGFENRVFPFLYKEVSDSGSAIWNPWLSWNFDPSLQTSESIQVFTTQPAFSQSIVAQPFLNGWTDVRDGLFAFLNLGKESLTYLIPVHGEGLVAIPGAVGILISAVYPNPTLSSNEWFAVCNRGTDFVDMQSFEIRDASASDRLVEYSFRFGTIRPAGWDFFNPDLYGWSFSDRILNPGECGYILSPNFKNESLPFHTAQFRKIYTIDKTSTIGNGISKNEGLDLFQEIQGSFIHVHSYGNQYSSHPFSINAETGDVILLKENRAGDSETDYEIKKKDSL